MKLKDKIEPTELEVMILEAVAGSTAIEGMTKAAEEYQKKAAELRLQQHQQKITPAFQAEV